MRGRFNGVNWPTSRKRLGVLALGLSATLGLCLSPPACANTFPIQITADHAGAVYVRTNTDSNEFKKISDRIPAVYEAAPGERVDIRVVGRAGLFTDWVGEQQGRTGPSNLTVRLEKALAWGRIVMAVVPLTLLGIAGLVWWRRRLGQNLAKVVQRAEIAETGTGIPKRIAHYEIVKLLGEGGMAHVYLGRDKGGAEFAVKIPKTVDERFRRECVIASTLESPHIVKAFDYCAEKAEGQPAYMAQEYLVGETLESLLEGTDGLPLEEVDQLFRELLDGLEAAHSQQILHRDIKPENLFVDRATGRPILKILDFGVAKAEDELLMTASGAMLGTALYSSPEQNCSAPLDQRSDLYSVGLVLYELLTGRRTWTALNRYDLLKLHNAGVFTPVKALRPDVPPEMDALVCDLLKSDPEGRPASVSATRARWLACRGV